MRIVIIALFMAGALLAQPERVTFPAPVSLVAPEYKFTGGKLAAFERQGAGIALYGFAGDLLYETLARPPEGPLLRTVDVAALRDGSLVAASEWTATNRGFVIIHPSGEVVRAVDTYPFQPRNVTAGPDDAIWLLGREPLDPDGDDRVLRRYSRTGELTLEALPLAEVPGRALGADWFGASNERLGLWFRRKGVWLELTPDGAEVARFPLRPPGGHLVLSDAGDIYAGASGALYRYRRESREWERVQGVAPEDTPSTLFGEFGPRLVFRVLSTQVDLIYEPQ